jgi:hypothetical protein
LQEEETPFRKRKSTEIQAKLVRTSNSSVEDKQEEGSKLIYALIREEGEEAGEEDG